MGRSSGKHFWNWVRTSIRILHRLWLEVTGFLFLALSLFGVVSLVKEWRQYQETGEMWKVSAAGVFTVVMLSFGIYSFFKSHRIR
jgi:hypothetical protein